MKMNLHTHTYRCGHATGTEREYIEQALANGVTHMGFSDHMPFAFPDGYESDFRIPMAQAREYAETISALKEEYRGKITLYMGFEMEYYPLYFREMLALANQLGAEYLLLGQHYIHNEHTEQGRRMARVTDREEDLTVYADTLIEAMEAGVFTYIAHPDLICFQGDPIQYECRMRRVCRAAVRTGTPLEINCLGIRDHRNYPNPAFWKIAGEEGCQTVIGFDAHSPAKAYDQESLAVAEQMIRQYNLSYVATPPLVSPQNPKRSCLI